MKFLFALLPTIILQTASAQLPVFVRDSLDSYIMKGLQDWDVPGLSIVVVKDGQVVVRKGYGVTDLQTREKVDENTLFFIASNTKLFTGTALAMLEHRGRLSLDDKITKYFPWFRLYDTISTKLVSIRDLLTHRIGTKTFQGDFTFWNTKLSRQEIMRRMRYLKPVAVFRQDYGYCNSCFLTAGEVVGKISGKTWEAFITDSILRPLLMNNSYALSAGIQKRTNKATPYTTSFTGILKQVPYDQWDNLGPAASVVSNVKDLTNWLLFQLDSGRFGGKQVIPFPVLLRTRDLNIVTGSRKSALFPVHFRGYGLGLFGADYNGRQIYWHTGGAAGMVSNVCFVPEERLGIAILTNNDNQNLFEALRYQLLDAYLGMPWTDRSQQQLTSFREDMAAQLKEIDGWKNRIKNNKPDLPLPAYTGSYKNQLYGTIRITQQGERLFIKFETHPDLTAILDFMDNGEWLIQYNNIEYGIFPVRFTVTGAKVQSLSVKVNDFVEYDPYVFVKTQAK